MSPAAISGATALVPCHVDQSVQLIWKTGTRDLNLRRVPDLKINDSDLT